MPEYVDPNAEMEAFFAHRRITHRKTRNWTRPGGQRHWFAIDPQLTLEETRDLLARLPTGAYVVSFDWKYDSPSDAGAFVALQRYPNVWTAEFSNHGLVSERFPQGKGCVWQRLAGRSRTVRVSAAYGGRAA